MGSHFEIMRTFALILAIAVASAYAGDITDLIEDCGSTGGSIKSLTYDGCDAEEDDYCEAAQGGTVHGQLTFTPTVATESLTCKIYGIPLGIEVPFPGGCPVVNACEALASGDCPIEAGEEFVYDMSLKIESYYPTGQLTGKWTLVDPSGNNYACFKFPIKIVSG